MLVTKHSAQVEMVCRVLELPRSSYYYHAQVNPENDLRDAIQSVAGQFPTYGTRRIAHQLRRPPYGLYSGSEANVAPDAFHEPITSCKEAADSHNR